MTVEEINRMYDAQAHVTNIINNSTGCFDHIRGEYLFEMRMQTRVVTNHQSMGAVEGQNKGKGKGQGTHGDTNHEGQNKGKGKGKGTHGDANKGKGKGMGIGVQG